MKRRRNGFAPYWLGEDILCDAKGAIKFITESRAGAADGGRRISSKPIFRRYFAGGDATWMGAVSRVDVGFAVPDPSSSRTSGDGVAADVGISLFNQVAADCLRRPVMVPNQSRHPSELHSISRPLAKRLLAVTTSIRKPPDRPQNWWLTPGTPLVLIEARRAFSPAPLHDALERAWLSDSRDGAPIAAHHFASVELKGSDIPVWIVLVGDEANPADIRNLRIHLWRLHNEREVLKRVLALCLEEKIDPATPALRDYLAEQSRRLGRKRTEGFDQRNLLSYAYRLDEMVNEQDAFKLQALLRSLSPGISASVMPIVQPPTRHEQAPQTIIYTERGHVYMDDHTQHIGKAENVGAIIGGHATVSNSTFQGAGSQTVGQAADQIDLDELVGELARLRATLRNQATDVEHDLAVAGVAEAEVAAKQGDREGAFKALRKGGKWALDAATQIGTAVAASAIRIALGM